MIELYILYDNELNALRDPMQAKQSPMDLGYMYSMCFSQTLQVSIQTNIIIWLNVRTCRCLIS